MAGGKFAENAGVKIYYEVEGEGQPLLLHHGFASSGAHWRTFGYVDGLRDGYRLITMDSRGHGRSDKPHDPAAYRMENRVGDILAVLDTEGLNQAHYWGYSMGGRMGFALVHAARNRVASLVSGGGTPYSPNHFEADELRRRAQALRTGDDTMLVWLGTAPEIMRIILERNDPEALAALVLALAEWDGVEPSTLDIPSMHYAGVLDPFHDAARRAAEAMGCSVFHSLPDLDHVMAYVRSDLFVPLVRAFLDERPPIASR